MNHLYEKACDYGNHKASIIWLLTPQVTERKASQHLEYKTDSKEALVVEELHF